MSWHETDTNILQPHAFFGGVNCWLKNGDIKCGMPHDNPIHKLPIEPCDHSFVCEICGDTASEELWDFMAPFVGPTGGWLVSPKKFHEQLASWMDRKGK